MTSFPQDVTHEDPPDLNTVLMRKLSIFSAQSGRTGFLIGFYGIISVVAAGLCSISHEPLLFGAIVPLFISGIVLFWICGRIWKIRGALRVKENGTVTRPVVVNHSEMISKCIAQLRQLRSAATLIFGIGIVILVLSCVFSWKDSITGLSLAMVIQFGLLGMFAMMITFWLEIHMHELERHIR